jgi:hypothetical protein
MVYASDEKQAARDLSSHLIISVTRPFPKITTPLTLHPYISLIPLPLLANHTPAPLPLSHTCRIFLKSCLCLSRDPGVKAIMPRVHCVS